MFNTMTIVLVVLTLSAVGAAGFAVAMLSKVKRGLQDLGMRILESQDIGKIKDAANKTGTFESRLASSEQKADETKNHLAEYKTKLDELDGKLTASEQKITSFDARFEELSTKLASLEQMVNRNENGLAQTVPNIKALADEIQNLKMFQTATEKARSTIVDAFNDMQVNIPSHENPVTEPEKAESETESPESSTPESAPTEEDSQKSDQWQEETHEQRVSGSRRWQS